MTVSGNRTYAYPEQTESPREKGRWQTCVVVNGSALEALGRELCLQQPPSISSSSWLPFS